MKHYSLKFILCAIIATMASYAAAQIMPPKAKTTLPPVSMGADGRLVYNKDSSGNQIPDFSHCGYMAANVPIPEVPIRVVVASLTGDATSEIQSALDYVASLPANKAGIRGAVLLKKGIYRIEGSLIFNNSGVVLRGSGMQAGETVLIGAGKSRATLLQVFNKAPNLKSGTLSQIGIENLRCRSEYDLNNPKDEAHRWMAITMEHVKDAWVRRVTFEHFAGSAVCLLETASRVTVEDCKSLAPVSEIAGQRRNTFYTIGKQNLFQRLYSEEGYHDFAVGFTLEGPNAFVQCDAYRSHNYSGTIEKTATKVLFDIVNIDGNALGFPYNSLIEKGVGPGVSNSVLWQCSAPVMHCFEPDGAINWAVGAWATFLGNGSWYDCNNHVQPRSLYYAQLSDRLGKEQKDNAHLLVNPGEQTTSPTVIQAARLIAEAYKPATTLSQWIDELVLRNPLGVDTKGVKTMAQTGFKRQSEVQLAAAPMQINATGWLIQNNTVMAGARHRVKYWNGNITPTGISEAVPHITRYVPGRTGTGLTDDLDVVTNWMAEKGIVALDHNYGLWYDRRRDDHERFRRMDGDALPPFYELPFARSGEGTAWDGLSKYDLTTYNPWYWSRLRQFARLADQKGLVLIHQNYFQHNILEAGGHYADYPWRPVNNINGTPFPEPVLYAEDLRIFIAEQYYDVSNPAYRALHKDYIRKCLDNFADNSNVIQLISAEYTGPLQFVKFWLDVIDEWERETGKKQKIGLSTTKDVQDSILADKKYAAIIDLIDIRFWYYQKDGNLYAPEGGLNLSPRQHVRQLKPVETSFEQVYRAVKEYKDKYPDKAVIFTKDEPVDQFGWAVFMAGGALADLPSAVSNSFLKAAVKMKPVTQTIRGQYVLAKPGASYAVYSSDTLSTIKLDLINDNTEFTLTWIDPVTGKILKEGEKIKGGKVITLKKPVSVSAVLWMHCSQV